MKDNQSEYRLRKDTLLFITVAIYFLIGLILIPVYLYHINPDGVAYISIAEKYSRGEWQDAVNGYWGPLYIWTMALFMFLPLDSIITAKLVLLLYGCAALVATRLLSFRFDIKNHIRNTLFVATVPAFLFFTFAFITADLVLLTVLLFYFYFIFDKRYPKKKWRGLTCGVIGGLLYFAKAYGLPFFLVHFTLMNVYYFFKAPESRSRVVRHFGVGFLAFFILSASWIAIISSKYEKLVIGTAGQFNHTCNYPGFEGFHVYHMGFFEPPNETAVAIGEDHFYLPHIEWSPFDSPELFRYYGRHLLQTNYGTLKILSGLWAPYYTIFSLIFPIAFAVFVFIYLFPFRQIYVFRLLWILSLAIFAMGYTLLVIRERFLWIVYVIGVLIIAHLLTLLYKRFTISSMIQMALLLVVAGIIAFGPIRNLWVDRYKGKELYEFAHSIESCYDISGDIASDSRWQKSFFTAFYLDCRYFGRVKKEFIAKAVYKDLFDYGIDYFFVWLSPQRFPFLRDFKELTGGEIPGLRIYAVPDQPQ